ncbi:MAG TPA: STAS-like domain-containing protein [Steroidobacteraceae bacterium]|jgi:hypothetical protein|nr:STAS-like domain-containing protein [Steroidobacteraceae bacterium]
MVTNLEVKTIINTPFGVASEDGGRLYEEIFQRLKNGESVKVSFAGITRLTTAFLNAGIGQVYNEFSEEYVREHLRVSNLDEKGLNLLRRVVDRAKIFLC